MMLAEVKNDKSLNVTLFNDLKEYISKTNSYKDILSFIENELGTFEIHNNFFRYKVDNKIIDFKVNTKGQSKYYKYTLKNNNTDYIFFKNYYINLLKDQIKTKYEVFDENDWLYYNYVLSVVNQSKHNYKIIMDKKQSVIIIHILSLSRVILFMTELDSFMKIKTEFYKGNKPNKIITEKLDIHY